MKTSHQGSQKLLGGAGHRGTDSEALQGWILKFGEDSKKLRISVETLSTGCPIRVCPGQCIVHLCLAAYYPLTSNYVCDQLASEKLGEDFPQSV